MNTTLTNIQEFINHTHNYQLKNPFNPVQTNIKNKKDIKNFIQYLCNIADMIYCDELDCNKSWTRVKSEKTHQEIINMINNKTWAMSGIKINHYPQYQFAIYEKWENGYIEGFIRLANPNTCDYFIWTYIKINKLENILKKFKNKLIYYK